MDSTGIDEIWEDDFGIIDMSSLKSSLTPISQSPITPYGQERKDIATEILKGMVSSGLVESPEDMAKEAVKIADALLAELNK
jgi:hypothetical protein